MADNSSNLGCIGRCFSRNEHSDRCLIDTVGNLASRISPTYDSTHLLGDFLSRNNSYVADAVIDDGAVLGMPDNSTDVDCSKSIECTNYIEILYLSAFNHSEETETVLGTVRCLVERISNRVITAVEVAEKGIYKSSDGYV